MAQNNIVVPYEQYAEMKEAADAKKAALDILGAEFTDEAERLVALKAVLGFTEG